MTRFYARMRQENEDDQLIVFDLPLTRVQELVALCVEHDLAEACIKMPDFERIAWPAEPPVDGFMDAETQDDLVSGFIELPTELSDHPSVALQDSLLMMLHVGAGGQINVELRGGPAGEWWSDAINIEEVILWLK